MRPRFGILYEMLGRSPFETLMNFILLTPKLAPYPLPNPPSHQHPSTFILPNLSVIWVARTPTYHFSNLNLLSSALSCLSLISRPYESILSIFIFLYFFSLLFFVTFVRWAQVWDITWGKNLSVRYYLVFFKFGVLVRNFKSEASLKEICNCSMELTNPIIKLEHLYWKPC